MTDTRIITNVQESDMKRTILLAFFSLLAIISVFPAAFAQAAKTVTILYTGSVKGTLDPCKA